jgi:hypothetical protein
MVIKNMSVWTEKVARGIYYVIEIGHHFLEFIFDVGKHLKNLWDSFPKGAKIAIAAITAINVALSAGPLGRSIMLISTLLLLIDDYYGYMEGKNAALGPYWDKLNEYLAKASQWYETLKQKAEPYWDMAVKYAKEAAKWIEEVVIRIKEWAEENDVLETITEYLKDLWDILVKIVTTVWELLKFLYDLGVEFAKTDAIDQFTASVSELWLTFKELCAEVYEFVEVALEGLFGQFSRTDVIHFFRMALQLVFAYMTYLNKATKFYLDVLKSLFKAINENKTLVPFWKMLGEAIEGALGKLGKFARAMVAFLNGHPKDAVSILLGSDSDSSGRNGQTSGLSPTEQKWEGAIQAAAAKYGKVSANTLRALMMAESSGDENAKSDAGAIGLMQLMPDTAAGLGVNPYDPEQNIDGGARYLNQLLEHYDSDAKKAIAAYNWGSGNVDSVIETYGDDWENHLPYETKNHIKKVLRYRDQYESNTTYGYTPSGKPFDNRFWRIWSSKEGMDAPWDSTATNVKGWKPEVVDFMNELGPALNRAGTIGVITGAAEGSQYGHMDGPFSHGAGYKVDISDSNIAEGSEAYRILKGMVDKYGGKMVHEADRGHYDIVIYPMTVGGGFGGGIANDENSGNYGAIQQFGGAIQNAARGAFSGAFKNMSFNPDLVQGLLAGGAGGYQNYGGSSYNSQSASVINNVNVDLTINGEGKTNADVGQVTADTVVRNLESRAAFQQSNIYNGSGGPAFV